EGYNVCVINLLSISTMWKKISAQSNIILYFNIVLSFLMNESSCWFNLSNEKIVCSLPFSTLLLVLSLPSSLLYDHGQLVDIHQTDLLKLAFRIFLQYD